MGVGVGEGRKNWKVEMVLSAKMEFWNLRARMMGFASRWSLYSKTASIFLTMNCDLWDPSSPTRD